MFRKSLNFGEKYIFCIPIILAFFILFININKPFVGFHDFNNVQYGTMAQNYIKEGVWNLKFGQIMGKIHGDFHKNKPFYTSYLPLLPLMVAGSFSFFGMHEWSVRIIPVLFSTFGVLFFFLLVKKLWGGKAAFVASFFYILNPMFIYFGNMADVDVLILPMMILYLTFYLNWIESGKNKYLFFLCSSLFFGGLIGWIIVYLGPLFILHSILIGKFKLKVFIPGLVLLFIVLLQFIHAYILSEGDIFKSAMLGSLKNRLTESNLSFGGQKFTPLSYLKKEISMLQAYFTRTLIMLSLSYVVINFRNKLGLGGITLFCLLILGIAHPLIFSRAIFIHDYQNIYLLPFLSAAGALMVIKIIAFLKKIKITEWVILLLVVALFFIFVTERINFAKALLATNMNKQGFEMAGLLNSLQNYDNEVSIASRRFVSFYGLFTDYYSNYRYGILEEDTLKKEGLAGLKYAIFIDEDIQDQAYYKMLTLQYKFFKTGEWTVIKNEKR